MNRQRPSVFIHGRVTNCVRTKFLAAVREIDPRKLLNVEDVSKVLEQDFKCPVTQSQKRIRSKFFPKLSDFCDIIN